MPQENKNWCEEFFDDLFAEHHLVRTDEKELQETIAFLEEKLHLKPKTTIFDQCCGVGSLSIALAQKGYNVTGMDLIHSYIERARRDAGTANICCTFAAADAHDYITPVPCDAAINWWTSFGYTPDDAQNIKMLHCVAASLKTGGWFAMDYMNSPQRLKAFGASLYSVSEIKKENCTITWESYLDSPNNMIVKKWIYTGADGKKIEKQGGGAKLYMRSDLEKMFTTCGFKNIQFYGSMAGEPLDDASPRCIVVAQKGT